MPPRERWSDSPTLFNGAARRNFSSQASPSFPLQLRTCERATGGVSKPAEEISTSLLKVWMECRPSAVYEGGWRRSSIGLDAVWMILTAGREARPAIGLLRLNLLVRHMAQHQSGQHDCDDQSGRKHPCLSPSTDAGSLIRILGAFAVKIVHRLF